MTGRTNEFEKDNVIFTPKPEEEGRIDEFPSIDETTIGEELNQQSKEEVEGINEGATEGVNEGVNEGEEKELTEEEKREIFINALKQSKIRFRPIKNATKTVEIKMVDRKFGGKQKQKIKEVQTNVTVNPYGKEYKKERRRKNKMQRASRKANR